MECVAKLLLLLCLCLAAAAERRAVATKLLAAAHRLLHTWTRSQALRERPIHGGGHLLHIGLRMIVVALHRFCLKKLFDI